MGDGDAPEAGSSKPEDAEASVASDHLIELLGELRARFQIAPPEATSRPDAPELIRQAQERIEALDRMLAWARSREAELTARTVRADMKVAHLESTVSELNALAKRTSDAEASRLRAESNAAESLQRLATLRAELDERDVEMKRLSTKCRELESDLLTLADEVAASSVARARAERLERERDVALERARADARIALDERLRSANAEREIETLRERLRQIEGALSSKVATPTGAVATGAVSHSGASTDPTGVDDVVITEAEADGSLALAEDDWAEDDDVVDLTEEPSDAEDDETSRSDEAIVWGEPGKQGGLVGWLRRGFSDSDYDE